MSTSSNSDVFSDSVAHIYDPPSATGPDFPPYLFGDEELGLFPGFVTLLENGKAYCYMKSNKKYFKIGGDQSWVKPAVVTTRFVNNEYYLDITCHDGQVKDRTCFWTVTVADNADDVNNPRTPYKNTITITQRSSSSMPPPSSSLDSSGSGDEYSSSSWADPYPDEQVLSSSSSSSSSFWLYC